MKKQKIVTRIWKVYCFPTGKENYFANKPAAKDFIAWSRSIQDDRVADYEVTPISVYGFKS